MSNQDLSYFRDRLDEIARRGFLKSVLAAAGSVAVPKPLVAAIKAFPLSDIELLDRIVDVSTKLPTGEVYDKLNTEGLWYLRNIGSSPDKLLTFRDLYTYLPKADINSFMDVTRDEVLKRVEDPDYRDFSRAAERFFDQYGNMPIQKWLELFKTVSSKPLQMQRYFDIISQAGRDPIQWLSQNAEKTSNLIQQFQKTNLQSWSKHLNDLKGQGKEPQVDKKDDTEWEEIEAEREKAAKEKELKTSGTATGKLVQPWNVAAKNVNFKSEATEIAHYRDLLKLIGE